MSPFSAKLRRSAANAVLSSEHGTIAPPAPKTPKTSTARSLRDLLANPALLRQPDMVIPFIVVEGRVTLLSGREKIGKSTLVAGAVANASCGDPVLGVAIPRPVRTLWYAIDEPLGDVVRRFHGLRADSDQIIINDAPRSLDDLLTALELDLAAVTGVRHVVIDTMSKLIAMTGVDPNASREVEPFMTRLVDCLHKHNVAATLIYHTGKSGREYRGSTSIGATVDDILTLRKRGKPEDDDFDTEAADGDGRRNLEREGRNLRGEVRLDWVCGVYQLYEESASPRLRILETLRDHGTVTTRSALCKLAGVQKQLGLRTLLGLISEGAVTEHGSLLKIGRVGLTELGSRVQAVSLLPASPEPIASTPQLPGSDGFPEDGTVTEPRREPAGLTLTGASSPYGNPTAQKPEPIQSRQISRNGQSVIQQQHGGGWDDVSFGVLL